VLARLGEIDDDDGSVGSFPDAPAGGVGYSWLDKREYGEAGQTGRYCFITHSRSIAALLAHYPFERYGLAASDVDVALLKDASDRALTRGIARWLYDLHNEAGETVVDGVEFRSRHGDDIRVWAVFERAGDPPRSPRIEPTSAPARVTPELPELLEASAASSCTGTGTEQVSVPYQKRYAPWRADPGRRSSAPWRTVWKRLQADIRGLPPYSVPMIPLPSRLQLRPKADQS
jgi:hypothetical protein